jgi:hypothetical protein
MGSTVPCRSENVILSGRNEKSPSPTEPGLRYSRALRNCPRNRIDRPDQRLEIRSSTSTTTASDSHRPGKYSTRGFSKIHLPDTCSANRPETVPREPVLEVNSSNQLSEDSRSLFQLTIRNNIEIRITAPTAVRNIVNGRECNCCAEKKVVI